MNGSLHSSAQPSRPGGARSAHDLSYASWRPDRRGRRQLRPLSGEVLGLVGESGSGKSVTLRSLVRLIHAPGVVEGSVRWHDRELMR